MSGCRDLLCGLNSPPVDLQTAALTLWLVGGLWRMTNVAFSPDSLRKVRLLAKQIQAYNLYFSQRLRWFPRKLLSYPVVRTQRYRCSQNAVIVSQLSCNHIENVNEASEQEMYSLLYSKAACCWHTFILRLCALPANQRFVLLF